MRILRPEEALASNWAAGPLPENLSAEQLKEVYTLLRAAFTADDLQRFTEIEEDIPIEEVLAEMEEILKPSDQEKQ
jgi:hypothetical protein